MVIPTGGGLSMVNSGDIWGAHYLGIVLFLNLGGDLWNFIFVVYFSFFLINYYIKIYF